MAVSPYINHFIQPDTIIPNPANPQSWNRYSYVQNNPIRFNDPTGHRCAPEDECSGPRYTQSARVYNAKWRIKDKFGVTMSDDGDKNWDIHNLNLMESSLKNIDATLNGNLKSLAQNWTFRLMNQNPADGAYHGVTHIDGSRIIDFYTLNTQAIRQMNIYHEVGHLIDNTTGMEDYFTNAIRNRVWKDSAGQYLFGGYEAGTINAYATLKSPYSVYDPNYGSAEAIQHASSDPSEQWADMFANYVAGNIYTDNNAPGQIMQITVVQLLLKSGAYQK